MKPGHTLILTAALSFTTPILHAQTHLTAAVNRLNVATAQGGSSASQSRLPETLKKLDAASARFKSVSADFHKSLYSDLVKDTEVQDGSLYVIKSGGTFSAGLRISGKHARIFVYKNGIAKADTPGTCYNTLTGGQATVEEALTLGFGGSGTDLEKHWQIQDDGEEKINGVTVEKLELTPRDEAIKQTYTRIDLWIDLSNGIAFQQKSYASSKDTQTASYSNIKLNQAVDNKPFQFKDKECSQR